MNNTQIHELNYWRWELGQRGKEGLIEWRHSVLDFLREHFQQLDLKGNGLEIGTGPICYLGWSEADSVVTIDPLQEQYLELIHVPFPNVTYLKGDGEDLPFADSQFDWVLCNNVIDHTPHPEKMLAEIHRVLKRKFYFEVNFDYGLAPAHYGLWNKETVDKMLVDFVPVFERAYPMPHWNQDQFYGIYLRK